MPCFSVVGTESGFTTIENINLSVRVGFSTNQLFLVTVPSLIVYIVAVVLGVSDSYVAGRHLEGSTCQYGAVGCFGISDSVGRSASEFSTILSVVGQIQRHLLAALIYIIMCSVDIVCTFVSAGGDTLGGIDLQQVTSYTRTQVLTIDAACTDIVITSINNAACC